MKLIRTASLVRRQKDSIVHCEIELCLAPGASGRYLVNLRQGRMGEEWRETTRTPQPVALADADADTLFHLAVTERMAQGFVEPADLAPAAIPAAPPPIRVSTEADRILLHRLDHRPLRRRRRGRGDAAVGGTRRQRCRAPRRAARLADSGRLRCAPRPCARARCRLAARPARDMGTGGDRCDGWRNVPLDAWLEQLDQVAQADDQPLARRVLLAALRAVPLAAGSFRAVRHLFKMAEMRADGELFGLLQRRFETTAHTARRYVHTRRGYRSFAEEAARPDSTVAYGS